MKKITGILFLFCFLLTTTAQRLNKKRCTAWTRGLLQQPGKPVPLCNDIPAIRAFGFGCLLVRSTPTMEFVINLER